MYYYGGYSQYNNSCNNVAYPVCSCSSSNSSYGSSIVLVLFILLVIILGTRITG